MPVKNGGSSRDVAVTRKVMRPSSPSEARGTVARNPFAVVVDGTLPTVRSYPTSAAPLCRISRTVPSSFLPKATQEIDADAVVAVPIARVRVLVEGRWTHGSILLFPEELKNERES